MPLPTLRREIVKYTTSSAGPSVPSPPPIWATPVPPGTTTHLLSPKFTLSGSSLSLDCISSGRKLVSSDCSAARAVRLPERTAENVATASTSVPSAVPRSATVAQLSAFTRSPAVMDGRAEVLVVQVLDGVQGGLVQRGQRGRLRVLPGLGHGAGPGDDRGHAGLLDDPAQRGLGRRGARRGQRGELLGRLHPGVVVDSGERLAHVERFAVPVEVAVVVGGELGVAGVATGQQARGQRHPGQDADPGRGRR